MKSRICFFPSDASERENNVDNVNYVSNVDSSDVAVI